jgi:cytochrome c peroxidase
MKLAVQFAFGGLILLLNQSPLLADVVFNEKEISHIRAFGPWPPTQNVDLSNKASGDENAVALGQKLFSDRRFSKGQKLSCQDCHQAEYAFADSVALNRGLQKLTRHTPSVLNLGGSSWFGWSGAGDSLWMQSLRPIIATDEMGMTVAKVAAKIRADKNLMSNFGSIFEKASTADDEMLFVILGKVLAAYQETLISAPSAFDKFRDALVSGETEKTLNYPEAAKRGLKIFIGEGKCHFCHFGPTFTTGEFADIGISQFTNEGGVDRGRYGGIEELLKSPFNGLGKYNDDPLKKTAIRTKHLKKLHRNFGEFKIPSLRNVSKTPPYMHNGSLKSLEDVVEHYSDLDMDRIHQDTETLLRPLKLTDSEKIDLISFLKTL